MSTKPTTGTAGTAQPHHRANPVIAEVIRSGFTESWHRGAVVGLAASGAVAVRAGDIGQPVFPRSSNKPLQAAGMLRLGLDLDEELLALAAASHYGEDFHLDGVRTILKRAGLTEDDLRCPASWPLDEQARADMIRRGEEPSRIRMNCSGKHAAMLATCRVNGWPAGSYLDAGHPLQRALRSTVAELAGEPVAITGVDGCGAPLFALSLTGLARAFRALALAAPGTPEGAVAAAMRRHPAWVSGTHADARILMDAVPGLLLKGGAEGVDAFAFDDGRAGAVKLDDGGMRARTPVTVALLRRVSAGAPDGLGAVPARLAQPPVTGGDSIAGAVRAVL